MNKEKNSTLVFQIKHVATGLQTSGIAELALRETSLATPQ